MKERLILCDSNLEWSQSLGEVLSSSSYSPLIVTTGKETQKELYDDSDITTLILNWDTREHSALEVMRYVKSMKPSLRILILFDDQQAFDSSGLDKKDFIKLGVTSYLIKPFNHTKILQLLNGGQKFDTWKDASSNGDTIFEPEEVEANDNEFTRVKLKDFASGSRTVFNHYVKLGQKKYLKILHKGEAFSSERVSNYIEKEVDYLYFKSSDRTEYINYLNSLIKKNIYKDSVKAEVKVNMTKMGSELIVEEMYLRGLSPALMKESKEITEGVHETLKSNPDVFKVLRNMVETEPTLYSQAYLTSLFGGMICIQLPWAGKRTADIVGQASFLLDIGKLKLPPSERNIALDKMKPDEKKRYESHPELSVDMLSRMNFVSDNIRQVILDHHEYVNGEGYPKCKTGVHIYPMAKIVCFASEFAEFILKEKITPVEGMKRLLILKKELNKYDAEVVRCFVSSLMQKTMDQKTG